MVGPTICQMPVKFPEGGKWAGLELTEPLAYPQLPLAQKTAASSGVSSPIIFVTCVRGNHVMLFSSTSFLLPSGSFLEDLPMIMALDIYVAILDFSTEKTQVKETGSTLCLCFKMRLVHISTYLACCIGLKTRFMYFDWSF